MALGRKTGGRVAGTPNKKNPLKGYLRAHSIDYFTARPRTDDNGNNFVASDFDIDIAELSPADRVTAELKLLKFHTPEMKSVDMDMTIDDTSKTIADRLSQLVDDDSSAS
ncbi:hypothetical protein [uncultured Muribaculum sp.]|uniref:hypothetical protein n=1 Tax=uncultured Muribaculum sp. TaxID=1918613 RepID=UPI0025AFB916|nr:hypothetical protein [uncultured Muribaculum sp.]